MKLSSYSFNDFAKNLNGMNFENVESSTINGIGKVSSVDMSRVIRNPVFEVSDQVRYKPSYTTTEDG